MNPTRQLMNPTRQLKITAREQTWPPTAPMIRHECPLPACTWTHEEPDWSLNLALIPEPTSEQLEQARLLRGGLPADPVLDGNLARMLVCTQRTETTLRQHFESHALVDWVMEVIRLQSLLAATVELGKS